jgi:hypothetical protein
MTMSMAFRKHNFNLDEFERCEKHGWVMMQVARNVEPVCLLDWLTERAGNRAVRDVIPREAGEYNLPALILDNGFMLPVQGAYSTDENQALEAMPFVGGNGNVEIDLRFAGWWVSDVLFVRAKKSKQEAVLADIRPPDQEVSRKEAEEFPSVLLHLSQDILLYLLFDEEFRKIEP